MKLEYNILWLDDRKEEFLDGGLIDQIEDYLFENGMTLYYDFVDSYEEFAKLINQNKDFYDLILTDYWLNKDKKGDDVVNLIRGELKNLTEILFYTADELGNNVERINRISYLETKKYKPQTHQEVVIKYVIELIKFSIRKYQDIVPMRGLIMNETSFLDEKIDNIVSKYLKCGKNCNSCDLYRKCSDTTLPIILEMESSTRSKLKLIKRRNFRQIKKDNCLYSADYKRMLLGEILRKEDLADFTQDYKSEITTIRNKFAHAILQINKDTNEKYFIDNKKEGGRLIFNRDFCINIRRNIRKYNQMLNDVEKKLFKE